MELSPAAAPPLPGQQQPGCTSISHAAGYACCPYQPLVTLREHYARTTLARTNRYC
jgi:hypothetical protein